MRLCTDRTAHRGSTGIALLFLDHGTSRGCGVSVTPRPLFIPRKDTVPIVQKAGRAPGPVWTGAENLAPHRDSIPGPSRPWPVTIPTELPGSQSPQHFSVTRSAVQRGEMALHIRRLLTRAVQMAGRQYLTSVAANASTPLSTGRPLLDVNHLTPNDPYRGSTAPLTFKVAFYILIQQI